MSGKAKIGGRVSEVIDRIDRKDVSTITIAVSRHDTPLLLEMLNYGVSALEGHHPQVRRMRDEIAKEIIHETAGIPLLILRDDESRPKDRKDLKK